MRKRENEYGGRESKEVITELRFCEPPRPEHIFDDRFI